MTTFSVRSGRDDTRPGQVLSLWVSIGIVLLAGFVRRVFHLDSHDIWGDEAVSIARSSLPIGELLSTRIETHPPLNSLVLFLWLPLSATTRARSFEPFVSMRGTMCGG